MKITRSEFKELVELYEELQDMFEEYEEYYNELTLEKLLFTTLDWLEDKLDINYKEETGEEAVLYIVSHNKDNKLRNQLYYKELLNLDFVYDELIPDKNKDN